VIHHGTVGYCDGLRIDGAHRWVATGGVPIEFLVETVPIPDWPHGSASHLSVVHAD